MYMFIKCMCTWLETGKVKKINDMIGRQINLC